MSAAGPRRGLPPCFDRADLMTIRRVGFADSLAHAKPRSREAAKEGTKVRGQSGEPRV